MGKYGKKVDVSLNPLDFNICILGESKIGKTTIAKEMCEKLVGEDGYIHFDIGREEGSSAIQNLVSEPIEDWNKLVDVCDDIVENKTTDYKDLKVVIWDTLDELVDIIEKEAIRQWNIKHADKKTDTINSAWNGFGKGQDYALDLFLDKMWQLKHVGVSSIIIGHVKRSDIIDPITQETFSKLTADTTQRYFNAIKNKMHFVALAYIDRDIVKEKTGRKNVATKQDITINKAVSESRVISFRDDTYSVDSGSRFSNIVDRIPFDTDAFIKAMKDAIESERSKSGKTIKESEKEQAIRDKAKEESAIEYSKSAKVNKVDEDRNEEIVELIKDSLTPEKKSGLVEKLAEYGMKSFKDVSNVPTANLEAILKWVTE